MQIFVGGWSGSGSRVVQQLFHNVGFHIGSELNKSLDFYSDRFVECFDQMYFHGDNRPLKSLLEEDLDGRDSWAIKHGHLMLCVSSLREWYPNSKFVLTVRHPVDNLVKPGINSDVCKKYGDAESLQEKLDFYGRATSAVMKNADLVVRLEDLCFDTHATMTKIFDLAGIDQDPNILEHIVHVPESIGRGRGFYGTVYNSIIEDLGYPTFKVHS